MNGNDSRDVDMPSREDSDWYLDDRIKRLLLDLQRHWLEEYQRDREKALVELATKVLLLYST